MVRHFNEPCLLPFNSHKSLLYILRSLHPQPTKRSCERENKVMGHTSHELGMLSPRSTKYLHFCNCFGASVEAALGPYGGPWFAPPTAHFQHFLWARTIVWMYVGGKDGTQKAAEVEVQGGDSEHKSKELSYFILFSCYLYIAPNGFSCNYCTSTAVL